MSKLRLVEFKHPDVLDVYPSILALVESTKNDVIPFNSDIIIRLLVTFEDHISNMAPNTLSAPDFKNMLYTLVEEQALKGFIISPSLREVIEKHRNIMDKTPINLQLQKFLIHSAKLG
jgi:hypothetical protein